MLLCPRMIHLAQQENSHFLLAFLPAVVYNRTEHKFGSTEVFAMAQSKEEIVRYVNEWIAQMKQKKHANTVFLLSQ